MEKLSCILLVDDNEADNFFHKSIIEEMEITDKVEFAKDGMDALDYLKNKNNTLPDLIFLDINMPKMNGWEFLAEYAKFDELTKSKIIIVILTTSSSIEDIVRSDTIMEVSDFETKPLDKESIENILSKFY